MSEAHPWAHRPSSSASASRVLVVDDEIPIVTLLRRVLERAGLAVETATSGRAALELLRSCHFDAVICDLRMPDVSGQQLYAYVRAATPDLAQRMIFLTGDASSDDAASFLDCTGSRFITKPFELRQILESVGEVLGRPAG